MLTPSERAWLLKNEPERYWEGLPKFFQAFLRSQLRDASETGDLDDMPDGLIELYTSGKMQIKGERSR
jgi:hypothetical protein